MTFPVRNLTREAICSWIEQNRRSLDEPVEGGLPPIVIAVVVAVASAGCVATPSEELGRPGDVTYTRVTPDLSAVPDGAVLADQFAQWIRFSAEGMPHFVSRNGQGCGLDSQADFHPCDGYCRGNPQPSTTLTFTKPVRAVRLGLGCVNSAATDTIGEIVLERADGQQRMISIFGGPNAVHVDVPDDQITELTITNIMDPFGYTYGDLAFDFPN